MTFDEDTCAWFGCPTPLEMYKHQCALLEDELTEAQARLHQARKNIAGLVNLSDELITGRAKAESELQKALAQVNQLNQDSSNMSRRIDSLLIVAEQRDHLFRENQQLLLERKVKQLP